ncbi:MAG: Hint domain-containing protein [Pseudomonadota bacterium]
MNRPLPAYETTTAARPAPISPFQRELPKRGFEIAWQDAHNQTRFDTVMAPADPMLEAIFANVARGAVITTDKGQTPVEDLQPGDAVQTVEFGPLPLRWIGSYTLQPSHKTTERAVTRMVRFSSDAFGLAKPHGDLLVSESAHILVRDAKCQLLFGMKQAYAPARAFEDGAQIFSITPAAPVTVYNLAFDKHATILANGIELESFNPGPLAEFTGDNQSRMATMRLFPHVASLLQFGKPATQRLTVFETSQLHQTD